MIIKFNKFHGAGNDFIVIDNRTNTYKLTSQQIIQLCERRFGIGADGIIFFNDSKKHDFEMKYYNADGSEGSMCGNAGRCATAFADFLGLGKEVYFFKAIDGLHKAQILTKNDLIWKVMLTMIDVDCVEKKEDHYFLNTGSPHHVEFVEDVENLDVFKKGKIIRYSKAYQPEGTNVNFASFSDKHILIRTYERGVEDETLACGTGVTAVALATAVLKNEKAGQHHYAVHACGGDLEVSFEKSGTQFTNIRLSGPAQLVFSGTINL